MWRCFSITFLVSIVSLSNVLINSQLLLFLLKHIVPKTYCQLGSVLYSTKGETKHTIKLYTLDYFMTLNAREKKPDFHNLLKWYESTQNFARWKSIKLLQTYFLTCYNRVVFALHSKHWELAFVFSTQLKYRFLIPHIYH